MDTRDWLSQTGGDFSPGLLRRGTNDARPEVVPLQAGPLTAVFDSATGFLRHIRVNRREVLLSIYVAERDREWGTVQPVLQGLRVEKGDDCFEVTFEAVCRDGAIDFTWRGRIRGEDVATVMMEMDAGTTVLCDISHASRWERERFPETFILVEGERGSLELAGNFWIRETTRDGPGPGCAAQRGTSRPARHQLPCDPPLPSAGDQTRDRPRKPPWISSAARRNRRSFVP